VGEAAGVDTVGVTVGGTGVDVMDGTGCVGSGVPVLVLVGVVFGMLVPVVVGVLAGVPVVVAGGVVVAV
jgi:hypothetical protein